jgi:Tfp pilus assembly protein PilO
MSGRPYPKPFWRRFLLWPALLLLAANLGGLFAYTLPRRLQERTLSDHLVTLREDVARERKVNEGLRQQSQVVGSNARDMQRFLKEVVAQPDSLSTILEELERMARESGLRTENRRYSRSELDKLPLVRFEVALPVAGSFKQLVGFLDTLERSPRFLTVDKVTYQDRSGDLPTSQIIVSAYFARGAEDVP